MPHATNRTAPTTNPPAELAELESVRQDLLACVKTLGGVLPLARMLAPHGVSRAGLTSVLAGGGRTTTRLVVVRAAREVFGAGEGE